MSESYFFAVIPRYLKVQHGFAKTIKPNTKYRIMIFKGIQKCDEMKQGIKSKLVGGKIDLQSNELFFQLPYYSPTKNIQFTIKLYQTKPNEEQAQIASYVILSSDYVKTFKNQKQTSYSVDGALIQDLSIGFDLFVEKSKTLLTQAIGKVVQSASKSNKQIVEQNRSVSGKSKQIIRQGEGFISPSRRLQRKRGHQGQLRSRNGSRQRSQQGSVTSSRRKFKKSSPSQKGEHFLHSPKKASPPKVGGQSQKGKSIPKSQLSSKSAGKQSQVQSNVEVNNQKAYKYQAPTSNKLKYVDTKQIFDIKVQRSSSPPKSNIARTNLVKPSITDNKSPPARSQVINSPTTQSLKNINQPTSAKSQILPKKELPVSPKNSNASNLEFQHTAKVFDVVHKRDAVSPPSTQQQKSPGKFSPTKSPKVPSFVSSPKNQTSKSIKQQILSKKPIQKPQPSKNQNQLEKSKSRTSQNAKNLKVETNQSLSISKEGSKKLQQSNIKIVMQGSVHSPKAQLVEDDKSLSKKDDIAVKNKPVKRINDEIHKSSTLRGSLRLKQALHQKQVQQQKVSQQKASQQRKNQIIYTIFLIVSMFLIYHAMSPTRKV